MMGSGLEIIEMGMEFKHGMMGLNTWVCGRITKLVETGNFIIKMVIYLRVHGVMIKLMDLGNIIMQMVQNTRDTGKTINKMAKG